MVEVTEDDVFVDDINILAEDGFSLAATLYLPRRGPKCNAILISSAAAVPRGFYRKFASYIASRGCIVLTYDYRGIGGSRPRSLVGFSGRMADWAEKDAAGAVTWMRQRYSSLPLSYVGHSFGGQALGLMHNNDQIARSLLIAAHAGFWKLISGPEKYRVYALLNYVAKPLANWRGYVPGRIGLGEDLPKDIFLQWLKWTMSERYYFDDRSLVALANYPHYRQPLRSLCIADDPWGTRPAIDLLCAAFTGTSPEIVTVSPDETDGRSIGHFGFFRSVHRSTLWPRACDWMIAT